jgi:hypothetical protein
MWKTFLTRHEASGILGEIANLVRAGLVDVVEDWPWSTHATSPLRELFKGCLTP